MRKHELKPRIGAVTWVEGWLTLAELRDADEVRGEYEALENPNLLIPLGLSGLHRVETMVLDANCDFFLPDTWEFLTPGMSPWHAMRAIAEQWKGYPIMDDLYLASLFWDEPRRLVVGIYAEEGREFTKREEAQLPQERGGSCCDCPECGTDHGGDEHGHGCSNCVWECAGCEAMFCNTDGLSCLMCRTDREEFYYCEPCAIEAREHGWEPAPRRPASAE